MIDETKIIHTQVYDDEHEEWIDKEMTIAEYLDAYTDEGCPGPCRDAVPKDAVLRTIEHMRKVCDTNDIDDYVGLLVAGIEELIPTKAGRKGNAAE